MTALPNLLSASLLSFLCSRYVSHRSMINIRIPYELCSDALERLDARTCFLNRIVGTCFRQQCVREWMHAHAWEFWTRLYVCLQFCSEIGDWGFILQQCRHCTDLSLCVSVSFSFIIIHKNRQFYKAFRVVWIAKQIYLCKLWISDCKGKEDSQRLVRT